jgi:hypothetical protein
MQMESLTAKMNQNAARSFSSQYSDCTAASNHATEVYTLLHLRKVTPIQTTVIMIFHPQLLTNAIPAQA